MNKGKVATERYTKDKLIFIDTNIYLDFYRTSGKYFQDAMIKLLNQHKNKVICTNQVFMEFLKNRNKLIIEIFNALKSPNWDIFRTPTFTNDAKINDAINRTEKLMDMLIKLLKDKIESLLNYPRENDSVYKFLHDFSINPSVNYLGEEHEHIPECKRTASEKILLGYPPSKKNDRSMGDLINWEWIIYCAKKFNKNVIIVSKDGDFGERNKDTFYINEWLKNDFNTRTQNKLTISLTDKLSDGFKMLNIEVSKEVIKEEKQLHDIPRYGLLSFLGENSNNNFLKGDSPLLLSSLLQSLSNQDNKP